MQGVCCASVLDAAGLCCPSGGLDECGVCDGDGTSCSLHLRLMLQVPQGMNITGAGTQPSPAVKASYPASPQLMSWLQALIQQVLEDKAPGAQLQPAAATTTVWPAWSAGDPFSLNTSPTNNRHLSAALVASADVTQPCALSKGDGGSHPPGCTINSLSTDLVAVHIHCPQQTQPYIPALDCPSTCARVTSMPQRSSARAALGTTKSNPIYATVRMLIQSQPGVEASSQQHLQLDVSLDPSSLLSVGSIGAGLLGVGQLLATGLEQQALNSSSSGPAAAAGTDGGQGGSAGPQLLRVMLVQRVGVCGNGLCEVGERELKSSEGGILQEAVTPCAQVCG